MAYTTSSLISRPVRHAIGIGVTEDMGVIEDLGVTEDLGDVWDTIKGGVTGVVDFFGASLKAQGASEALTQQMMAQQQAQMLAQQRGGISTPVLLIGGLAVAGVLVFALRKK